MSTSPSNAATPKRSPSVKRTSSSAVNNNNNGNNNGNNGRCPPNNHPENPEIEPDTAALALSSSPATTTMMMIAESPVQSIALSPSAISRRRATTATPPTPPTTPTPPPPPPLSPSSGAASSNSTTAMSLGDRKLHKSKLSASFRLTPRSSSRPSNHSATMAVAAAASSATMEAESGDSSTSSIPSRFFELLKRPFVHRKKQHQHQQQQQQQQQQQHRQSTNSTFSNTTTTSSTSSAVTGHEKSGVGHSSSSKRDGSKLRIRLGSSEHGTPDNSNNNNNQSSSEDLEEPEVVQVDGQLFRSQSLPQLLNKQQQQQQPAQAHPLSAATTSGGGGGANSHERAVRVNFIPADRGLHNSRYSGKDESPRGDRPNAVGKKSPARQVAPAPAPADSSPRKSSRRLPALTIDNIISSGLDSSRGEMEETASAMQRARLQWMLQHVVNTADDARSATHVVQEEPTFEPKRLSSQLEPQKTQETEVASARSSSRKSISRESVSSTADGTLGSAVGSSSLKKRLSVERRKSIEKRMSIERKRQSLEFFLKDIGEERLIEEPPAEIPDSCIPLRKRHSCSVPHLKRHTSEPKLNSSSISGTTSERANRNGRRTASSRNLIRERLSAGKFKTNEFFGFNPENRKQEHPLPMSEQIGVLQDSIRVLEQQTLSPTKTVDPGTPDNIVAPKLPIPQLRQHATSIDTQLTSPRSQSKITDENMTPSIGIISHQHNVLTNSMQALSSILHYPNEEPSTRLNAPQLLGLQPRQLQTSSSGSDTQNMTRRRWQRNQRSSPCEATSPTAAEITLSPSFAPPSPNSQPQTNFVLKPFQHLVGCPGASESGNESDTLCVFQTPPSHAFKPLHTAQSEVLEMQSEQNVE